MALREWLIKLLGGQTAPTLPTRTTSVTASPTTSTSTVTQRGDDPIFDPEPVTGPTSISLATGMTAIHFIQQDELADLPIANESGVIIKLVDGKLFAAAANGLDISGPLRETLTEAQKFPVSANNQYNISYNDSSQSLCLIGALMITEAQDQQGNTVDPTGRCQTQVFSLVNQTVNLRRTKANLEVRLIPSRG